jgi:hypothetical protein
MKHYMSHVDHDVLKDICIMYGVVRYSIIAIALSTTYEAAASILALIIYWH